MTREAIQRLWERNKTPAAIAAFCAAAFVLILIGVFAVRVPAVAMCVLMILEAGIAVMLHNAQIWVHIVLILAELAAGILVGSTLPAVLCILVYAAATAALQVLTKDDE